MTTTIHIYGPNSLIKGYYPKEEVHLATSYPVEGAKFSQAFRKGLWDGRKGLLNKRTGAFPTGLLGAVKGVLESNGIDYDIDDHRTKPKPKNEGFDLVGVSMTGKYSYQLDACKAIVSNMQGIVKAATNAGKSEIAAAVTKHLGLKTLFLVPSSELMYQTQKRFMKRLGLSSKEVGIIGDSEWAPGNFVTIAIFHTLAARLEEETTVDFLSNIDVLWCDECHSAGAEGYFSVSTFCPAYYRIGLSATPLDRTDGADLRLLATTGEIIFEVSNKQLVDLQVSAKADIVWDKVSTPIIPKKTQYPAVYKAGVSDNPELIQKVVDWTVAFTQENLSTLILVEEIEHGNKVDDALWNNEQGVFIPHQFIHGSEDTAVRSKAIEDFDARLMPVLVCSRILDQGVDTNAIDALIVAGSRKSKIKTMQRLGRGLRGQKLIVIEFSNYCHKYLLEHSIQRLKDYKQENCFPIHSYKEGTDKRSMIRDLWEKQGRVL